MKKNNPQRVAKRAQLVLPTLEQKSGPTFDLETGLGGRVAGLDEVGRGPLAGPVVAAAVILDARNIPEGIRDSKKLSAARREYLYPLIMAGAMVGLGEASVEEIDQLNILEASMLAMRRALNALPQPADHALVDGNRDPDLGIPTRCVVKGDNISLSIAAASIIAKVTRDNFMTKLAAIHPAYGWERNAGYGTRQHMEALKLVGASPFHRKSFAPIHKLMTQESAIRS